MRPITIAGGGLAGLALGIALRKNNVPVTVLESGNYPRHRVCGEFISGVTQQTLSHLEIPDILDQAAENQSTEWYSGDDCFLKSNLPTPALGISRFVLDAELAERFIEAGGELETEHRFSVQESTEEGTVLAMGRPRRKGSCWIGLKVHLENFKLNADLEMHLGSRGYLGISRVENGIANACGLFRVDRSLKASKTGLLPAYLETNGLGVLASRMNSADPVDESCLGVNAFELGFQTVSDIQCRNLCLGDQFAIIGPFTGNGMSMAFQSAALALEPLISYADGKSAWDDCVSNVQGRLRKHFKRRLRMSQMLHPFLTGSPQQKLLIGLGRLRLLPFSVLYQLVR